MLARHHDPIAAIATAPGRGAVGIVRVSGKGLGVLVEAVCGRTLRPREATYLPFRDAVGQPIDQGLALFFPAPHSYTGEDVLELQAHGGPVVLQLLLARCLEAGAQAHPATGQPALPGLRVAQPGEFTERAFLNGTGRGDCRPDRRLYHCGGAQRQPLAHGRFLARDPCTARCAHSPAHAGGGNARLS